MGRGDGSSHRKAMNVPIPYVLTAPGDGLWIQSNNLTKPIPWLILAAAVLAVTLIVRRIATAVAGDRRNGWFHGVALGCIAAAVLSMVLANSNGAVAQKPLTESPFTFKTDRHVLSLTDEQLHRFVNDTYPMSVGFLFGVGERGRIDDREAMSLQDQIVRTYDLSIITTAPIVSGDSFVATVHGVTRQCEAQVTGTVGRDIFHRPVCEHIVVLCGGIEPGKRAA